MFKSIFFKKLRVQIALYYLVASIFIVSIMGLVYYYSSSNIVLDETLEQTKYSVEQSGKFIEGFVLNLKNTASFISNNDDLKSYLTNGNTESRLSTLSLINNIISTNDAIVSIVAVGKNGSIVSNEKNLDMSISDNMMKEHWYINAIDNQQMPVLTSARLQSFSMDKDNWVISLSQEIVNSSGENLGVVLIDIRYKELEEYLEHLPLGESGYAFIMDTNSNLVYHPDSSYFIDKEKRQNLISMINDSVEYDASRGLLTHQCNIPNTNWRLVGVASLDRLTVVKRQLLEVLILVGLILFIVVLGGGYIVASRITKPINKLQAAMSSFDSDSAPIPVNDKSCYEVNNLNNQFNKMISEIKRLMEEIKENEQYLRAYELNALYSQINPHFLYNTLDTIVWMAEFNDSEKVIDVTKSLAQFFRISLSKGQEMISLSDEIDHITQYLFIQKQRYDDLLNYDIDLPDNLQDIRVPKIILQPIVENAIYHGIREKGSPGHIDVSCYIEDGYLYLEVKDNGVGFNQGSESKKQVKLGGVGIDNVRKRIKLVYGDAASLEIKSEIDKGTLVTIKLPYKE